jgi:hypothetical protein
MMDAFFFTNLSRREILFEQCNVYRPADAKPVGHTGKMNLVAAPKELPEPTIFSFYV